MAKQKFERTKRSMIRNAWCYYLLCIAMLLVAACLGACNNDKLKVEPPGVYIAGIVTDSLTQNPIDAAWVSNDSIFDSGDALTDSAGNYTMFTGTPGISREAFCGREGYITKKEIFSTTSEDTTIVNFELVPR